MSTRQKLMFSLLFSMVLSQVLYAGVKEKIKKELEEGLKRVRNMTDVEISEIYADYTSMGILDRTGLHHKEEEYVDCLEEVVEKVETWEEKYFVLRLIGFLREAEYVDRFLPFLRQKIFASDNAELKEQALLGLMFTKPSKKKDEMLYDYALSDSSDVLLFLAAETICDEKLIIKNLEADEVSINQGACASIIKNNDYISKEFYPEIIERLEKLIEYNLKYLRTTELIAKPLFALKELAPEKAIEYSLKIAQDDKYPPFTRIGGLFPAVNYSEKTKKIVKSIFEEFYRSKDEEKALAALELFPTGDLDKETIIKAVDFIFTNYQSQKLLVRCALMFSSLRSSLFLEDETPWREFIRKCKDKKIKELSICFYAFRPVLKPEDTYNFLIELLNDEENFEAVIYALVLMDLMKGSDFIINSYEKNGKWVEKKELITNALDFCFNFSDDKDVKEKIKDFAKANGMEVSEKNYTNKIKIGIKEWLAKESGFGRLSIIINEERKRIGGPVTPSFLREFLRYMAERGYLEGMSAEQVPAGH